MRMIKISIPGLVLSYIFYSLCINTLYAWSGGPPAYRTGAPNDIGTCNAIGCHNSFELNSGSAVFSINGPDTYRPGKFIKIEISFTESIGKLHGFEMTALDANNNRVGKFKKINKNTQIIRPNDSRGLAEEDKRKYVEHTFAGTKKKKWKVKWKAPADTTDPITFYAAGNEANGNGNPSGDFIYTTTKEINAASSIKTSDFDSN
ncbi:MAG: hypothetical protein E3K36_09290 [Candidatus Brocadia sp.]|nr:hypothetical protein [Candidatus Brocadia sp.]